MRRNARVRGLKTRNISQNYVSIDRLFSRLLSVAKNSLKSLLATDAVLCTGLEQLAARFEEQVTQQPNYLRNFISFRLSLPKLHKAGVKFLCIFDESQYLQVLHSTLDRYRNEVNVVGWNPR